MSNNSIKDQVYEKLSPIVIELGYELVEVEYAKKQNGMNMTLFIDSPNGVDMDGLEKVHRAVDVALDEFDPTNGAPYTLNCSSLGLDRPLKTDKDLTRNIGQMVEVSLYAKQDGQKEWIGELSEFDEQSITILVLNDKKSINRDAISKIKKHIQF